MGYGTQMSSEHVVPAVLCFLLCLFYNLITVTQSVLLKCFAICKPVLLLKSIMFPTFLLICHLPISYIFIWMRGLARASNYTDYSSFFSACLLKKKKKKNENKNQPTKQKKTGYDNIKVYN